MHPENDLSRPNYGEAPAAPGMPPAERAPGAPLAGSAPAARSPLGHREVSRPGRRGIVLGTAAVLALTGTVLGVAVTGMPSGHGAVTGSDGYARTRASGTSAASHSGQAAHRAAGHTAQQGSGSASQGAGSQGAAKKAPANHGAASQGAANKSAANKSAAATEGLRTSCRNVAHIGDSTSVDLISSAFLPDASQRLAARYRDVGVRQLRINASGGRSIVEELPGQRNGYTVASGWRAHGYGGCWVFALGTNDAANVAAGSAVGLTARIDQMMAVAHGQPVLWVNTRTELSAGPWSEANERAWDAALTKALARYPNMRIFNWSAVARPGWFLPDGIHYNTAGCAVRARAIANALARAFPLHGRSKGKVVL